MPSANETSDRIGTFLTELYRILEDAVALAVQDCVNRNRPIDLAFLASYVRHEALGRLRDLRGTPFECRVKPLNNVGVLAVFDGHALRIRKSRDGVLPLGQSDAFRLFCEQIPLQFVWANDPSPTPSADVNLIVLWTFDFETRSLSGVEVVMPHQWRFQVPYPAEVVLSSDELAISYDDLDIELDSEDDIALEDEFDHDADAEDDEEDEAGE